MVRVRELPRARLPARLAQHRTADLDHVAELVRERDERSRPDDAVARPVPAGERLERDERPPLEVDDRLVVDAELAALDRPLDGEGELLPLADPRVHLRLVRDEAALPGPLRVVHGDVRVPQQLFRHGDVLATQCDADAGVDRDVALVDDERLLDRLHQAVGDVLRLLGGGAAEEHRELVAAEASREVDRPDARLDAPGDGDQELVADVVAEAVVDRLEVVEVEEEHCRATDVAVVERAADPLREEHPVRQSRERVVVGLVPELVLQLRELRDGLLEPVVLDEHAGVARIGLEQAQVLGPEALRIRAVARRAARRGSRTRRAAGSASPRAAAGRRAVARTAAPASVLRTPGSCARSLRRPGSRPAERP